MSESDEQRPSCGCIKSQCIELARYYCSENCQCQDCLNTETRCALVEERVDLILEKNSHAFDPEIAVVQEATQIPAVIQEEKQVFVQSYSAAPADKKLSDVKGCSCQGIKCGNMNCECFKFMVGCAEICKCEECANSFGIKGRGSIIKQEIGISKIIKSEKYGTVGTTSEAIKMEIKREEGTQSEQTLSSYPNKRPRTGDFTIKSEQDNTGGRTNEAVNMKNPTQDASSSDPNKHL